MFRFHKTYFLLFFLLFVIEVLIALYVRDNWVRPYGGDVLVVIMIYCFIKSFLNTKLWPTAIAVLLFAFTIEILQYFNFVDRIGLGNNKIARIVIGTGFAWGDMIAYILGILIVISAEYFFRKGGFHKT